MKYGMTKKNLDAGVARAPTWVRPCQWCSLSNLLPKNSHINGSSQSIHNGKYHPILSYHILPFKKLLYQLYHTILQYSQHLKTLFFSLLFKYSFLLFFYYFSFILHFPLFLPQPLAQLNKQSPPCRQQAKIGNYP